MTRGHSCKQDRGCRHSAQVVSLEIIVTFVFRPSCLTAAKPDIFSICLFLEDGLTSEPILITCFRVSWCRSPGQILDLNLVIPFHPATTACRNRNCQATLPLGHFSAQCSWL
jgi:hypothetical protein